VSWDQRFFDPIMLPGRKPLVTLRDAALYITKLPKAEHDAEEGQAAMQALSARRVAGGIELFPSVYGFAVINIPRSPEQGWSINNPLRERPYRRRRLIPMSPISRLPIPC
jgi:hypothetical protein